MTTLAQRIKETLRQQTYVKESLERAFDEMKQARREGRQLQSADDFIKELSAKLDIRYDGIILPCPAFKEISVGTMEKYGIRLYSIYEDLEKVVVSGGKRKQPLCKQIYGFEGDLTKVLDEGVR